MNDIKIGKYCSIAEAVIFDGGFNHNVNSVSTYPFNRLAGLFELIGHPVCKGDIIVGNDVWIGEGAMIMAGVTIGDGAVIGARSVVTKDIEPYSISVGAPAKHKRYRFTKEQIEKLLTIKWWDWESEKIKANAQLLMGDIDIFLNQFYNCKD